LVKRGRFGFAPYQLGQGRESFCRLTGGAGETGHPSRRLISLPTEFFFAEANEPVDGENVGHKKPKMDHGATSPEIQPLIEFGHQIVVGKF
jgi:hypothetical protein